MLLSWSACAIQREASSSSRSDSLQSRTRCSSDSTFVQRIRYVHRQGDTVFVCDTLFRERFLVKQHIDTVYSVRQVEVRLPPVRYVPRFYKVSTLLAAVLLLLAVGRIALRLFLLHR